MWSMEDKQIKLDKNNKYKYVYFRYKKFTHGALRWELSVLLCY